MKKAFICMVVLCSYSMLSAQMPLFKDYLHKDHATLNSLKPAIPLNPLKKYEDLEGSPMMFPGNNHTDLMVLPGAELLGTLPGGNKLYRLAEDNMICIAPDLSPFNMPVIRGSDFGDPHIIKNPYIIKK